MRCKRFGITFPQVLIVVGVLCFGGMIFMYFSRSIRACGCSKSAPGAQNARQLSLAGIMYGGDFDDRIPVTTNGWLSRMQNISDDKLTVDAPAPGTQDFPAKAAGGKRTDAWPMLFAPYTRWRLILVNPYLPDPHKIFQSPPKAVTDKDYDPQGATYRNQNRFPFYGMNYMFLSPLRIPKEMRSRPDAVNYAVSESHGFAEADDPSGTVYFTESRRSLTDKTRGFFVTNAPGMWRAFATNKDGYVAFWNGTPGSGDWVRDLDPAMPGSQSSTNFIYINENSGCNAAFLDGHVKYYKDKALAAGTDYANAKPGTTNTQARIVDKRKYLWNLSDKNYYGQ